VGFSGTLVTRTQKSRYLSLLQIVAALGIVAYHVHLPRFRSGWILVELFFVIAGMNMVAALERDQSIGAYALSRVRRLGGAALVVWGVAMLLMLSGQATPGLSWFTLTGPVFAENLTVGLFRYTMPTDWVFAPLWFVCALLQLQLVLFLLRRPVLRLKPAVLVGGGVAIGVGLRLAFAALAGDSLRLLSGSQANALYCLPFTHLEAIVLGVAVGRGDLPRLGRPLPLLALVVGALAVTGRFDYPLRQNFAHVGGYTLLAFAAASLCARDGWPARAVERLAVPPWVDALTFNLASLTYGAYAFHGLIMASGLNAALAGQSPGPGMTLLLSVITAVQSFVLAWVLDLALRSREGQQRSPVAARVHHAMD